MSIEIFLLFAKRISLALQLITMRFLLLGVCLLCVNSADAGYQANINFGTDSPNSTDTRNTTATLAQAQFSTYRKFIRLQSSFTGLFGSGYLEGEGGLGLAMYLVSPFVSQKAPVQPFLMGVGTAGIREFEKERSLDSGFGYGVGADFHIFRRGGMTLSIQQHKAKEDTLRILAGFYWYNGDL